MRARPRLYNRLPMGLAELTRNAVDLLPAGGLEAKLKLGMQKPSEHLVVINDLNQGRPNLAASLPEAKLSNPQKWLRYFFQN